MDCNSLDKKNTSEKHTDRLWQWVLHEDDYFIQRASFFLVAQAMLLAAFATAVTSTSAKPLLIFVVGVVGGVCSVVWMYVSWIHINFTIKPLTSELKELLPEQYEVVAARRRFPSTDVVVGVLFPGFLLVVWVILMVAKLVSAI